MTTEPGDRAGLTVVMVRTPRGLSGSFRSSGRVLMAAALMAAVSLPVQGVAVLSADAAGGGVVSLTAQTGYPFTFGLPAWIGNLPAIGGAVPPGIGVSSGMFTGPEIAGVPTAAGNFAFSVAGAEYLMSVTAAPMSGFVIQGRTLSPSLELTIGREVDEPISVRGGSAPYTFRLADGSLPDGLTLSPGGVVSAVVETPVTATVDIEATDVRGAKLTVAVPVRVTEPLEVTVSGPFEALVGVPFSASLTASGGSGWYSWWLPPESLPPGLRLSGSSVTGTPTVPGRYVFRPSVSDGSGRSGIGAVVLHVGVAPLQIRSQLPAASVATAYAAALTATGGQAPYRWALTAGSLPAGLQLSAEGLLAGVPSSTAPGTFTVQVTDAADRTALRSFTMSPGVAPLAVSTRALPPASMSTAYSAALSATGGQGSYSWTLTSGALPAGLKLAANGVVSGTPTALGSSTFTLEVADTNARTASRSFTVVVAAPLKVTTSSLPAGLSASVFTATLRASGGTSPYAWTVTSGVLPPGLALNSAGVLSGTPAAPGSWAFTVRVLDAAGRSALRALTLEVAAAPTVTTTIISEPTSTKSAAPTADAVDVTTEDLVGLEAGTPFTADLGASGGTGPYTWALSGGTLPTGIELSPSGALTGTPAAAGSWSFTVRAADSAGLTGAKAFTVAVDGPISVLTENLDPISTGRFYYDWLRADGAIGTVAWTVTAGALPDGLTLDPSGSVEGSATATGPFSFTVEVADSTDRTASRTFSGSVTEELLVTSVDLPDAAAGSPYTVTLTAGGGTPPYRWVPGESMAADFRLSADGVLSGTPLSAGDARLSVRVYDADGRWSNPIIDLAVLPTLTVAPSALPAATVGAPYAAVLTAAGGTGPYTWSVDSGTLPAGLVLSPAGVLSGTPTTAGFSAVTVRVADSLGLETTKDFGLPVASRVTVTSSLLAAGTVGSGYSAALSASGGSRPYKWSLASGVLPAGLTLSPGGTLSGTPTVPGPAYLTVQAVDSRGRVGTRILLLNVRGPLAVTSTTLRAASNSVPYAAPLTAGGGTGPYTWSLASGTLPAGLTLSPGGTLSGTPASAGTSPFAVRVSDSAGASVIAAMTLEVAEPLAVTTTALPRQLTGRSVSSQLVATGGTGPYTWTVTGGLLPLGLGLSSTGVLSGTPNTAGGYAFTVRVTDAAGRTADRGFVSKVAAPLVIPARFPAPPSVGEAYSWAFTANGGSGTTTWVLASGSLPAGLTLSPGGVLSGTPTTVGSSTFTVRAYDGSGQTASFSHAAKVTLPLTITTTSLSGGLYDEVYVDYLGATGGLPSTFWSSPYRWRVVSGSLPEGLLLEADGMIYGRPAGSGWYTFTVAVEDAAGRVKNKEFSVFINPIPPEPPFVPPFGSTSTPG